MSIESATDSILINSQLSDIVLNRKLVTWKGESREKSAQKYRGCDHFNHRRYRHCYINIAFDSYGPSGRSAVVNQPGQSRLCESARGVFACQREKTAYGHAAQ